MRLALIFAAGTIVTAGLSLVSPAKTVVAHAVTRPAAEAHVVMTPPPDLFGSMLIVR